MKTETRGRPKTFNEEEALTAAMNYFWEHGYDNTSLDNLLLAMNIKKSSFYATFKSKEEIFSRTLQLYRQYIQNNLKEMKNTIGAKATLLAVPKFTIQELKETGKVRGCLLMNASMECYSTYESLSQQIKLEFIEMDALFSSFIHEAKEMNQISNNLSTTKIKSRYLNTLNGLVLTIQSGATQESIDDVLESIEEILN